MTSKSSYRNDAAGLIKTLISRRVLFLALCALSLAAYWPVRLLLRLNEYSSQNYFQETAANLFNMAFSSSMIPAALCACLGTFAALEGFAFLFSRVKTDFYMSLPVSRKKSFIYISMTEFLIFAACYVASLILAVLIGLAGGYAGPSTSAYVLFALLRDMSVYLASFGIAAFSAMCAGSLIYAIYLDGFLFFIGAVFADMLRSYMEKFFDTFAYSHTSIKMLLSIPWHMVQLERIGNGIAFDESTAVVNGSLILKSALGHIGMLFVCALIFIVLAAYLYKKRKAEACGNTILFYPVHVCVKFVCAVIGAMALGILVANYFYNDSFVYLALIVLIVAGLISICIEMFYKRSVKISVLSLFHAPVAMAAAYLFLLSFRLDVAGYDRFIPTAKKVESCALVMGEYGNSLWGDGKLFVTDEGKTIYNTASFEKNYMYITDIDLMEKLVRQLLEADTDAVGENGEDEEVRYNLMAVYRLKKGKIIYRRLIIPASLDLSVVAEIVNSAEYKEGAYQIYHADALESDIYEEGSLTYYTASGERKMSAKGVLGEFFEAYRKDMDALTFDTMFTTQNMGTVTLLRNETSLGNYYAVNFPVYSSFSNTKSFLEKYGIFQEVDPESVEVTKIDVSVPIFSDYDENTVVDYETLEYTDKEQIKELMDAVVYTEYLNPWFDYAEALDSDFFIDNYYYNADSATVIDTSYSYQTRMFLKDLVPDFLKEDAKRANEEYGG